MTEKKKRGRPPESGKKMVAITQTPEKPTILNGPVFDEGRIQKRINELANHQSIPFEETSYPSNWNELGKLAKLQWLTEHRK